MIEGVTEGNNSGYQLQRVTRLSNLASGNQRVLLSISPSGVAHSFRRTIQIHNVGIYDARLSADHIRRWIRIMFSIYYISRIYCELRNCNNTEAQVGTTYYRRWM